MRERIQEGIKDAMLSKDTVRLCTLRLMAAAIKDQDIARRTETEGEALSNSDIIALFAKMVRQREESARIYEEAGRMELAEQERREQSVLREFLPKPMNDAEVQAAVAKAISDTGAQSIRDMGKVMGTLKATYAGRMDFSAAGGAVRHALG